MHGRGGFPVKNVIFAVFIVLLIYMTYLYNGSQNRLREAEMTGARYKREADDRITEIQDLVRAKDKAQEAWQNEKFELNNRIKSINQQHSMLQGQYKEIEADLLKLKDDMAKMSEAQQDTVNKHAQEFQVMKQEKENEISTLQNKVADMEREKSEYTRQVQILKDKLIQAENEKAQLENENKNLKQQLSQADASKLSGQQGQPQQQQQQQQQLKTTQPDLFKGDQPKFGQRNSGVEHMQMGNDDAAEKVDPFKQFENLPSHDKKNDLNNFIGRGAGDAEAEKKKEAVEELNAQHQMIAPGHNQVLANDDDEVRNGNVKRSDELDKRPDVNPNDEQRGQILEPGLNLHEQDKAKGDEGDKKGDKKDTNVNVDDEGEDEKLEHKMPLALGQIQGPQPGVGAANNDHKEAAQQQPPILNENNDRPEDKNAGIENQYFGEEDNQQGDDDVRGADDNHYKEGRQDREPDNQDQFEENDNAALDRANE